jgi:hypothetical protein
MPQLNTLLAFMPVYAADLQAMQQEFGFDATGGAYPASVSQLVTAFKGMKARGFIMARGAEPVDGEDYAVTLLNHRRAADGLEPYREEPSGPATEKIAAVTEPYGLDADELAELTQLRAEKAERDAQKARMVENARIGREKAARSRVHA